MAFTGHVLRGSSGKDAIQILEGKLEKKQHREDRDEWLDDIKEWTQIKTYEEIKNLAQDIFGELALRHVNLLFQKTTQLMMMICK